MAAMHRESEIEGLIENTNKEYEKRIELEKERKDMVLKYMARHEEDVRRKFEEYREEMNKELTEFAEYVNYIRRKKAAGEEVEISEEFLTRWKDKIQEYEAQRVQEEEKVKRDIDAKYNSMILKKLVDTTYSDKLYHIAMNKPEVWRELKRKEYGNKVGEEKAVARDQVQDKYKLLNQGLEDEQYLNDIMDKGQVRLLKTLQGDLKAVYLFLP
eukprot:TRINITY_DN3509_c0_g1_i10.p1 TRINITY_DN3509_c0_g1~~TRINITY_DN3509_c0_g1_i10.p1  ORF type:complete len:213 (+),score=70.69 TRINITY_DN3509_c0_g1_i10:759-1397(+)